VESGRTPAKKAQRHPAAAVAAGGIPARVEAGMSNEWLLELW
jgi:hypothetical protein